VGASSKDGTVEPVPLEPGALLEELGALFPLEPESSDCVFDGEFGDVLMVFESGEVEPVVPATVVCEPATVVAVPATSAAATATLPLAVLIRTVSADGSEDSVPSPPQPAAATARITPVTNIRRPVFLIDMSSS
jgi:hypothetical protein